MFIAILVVLLLLFLPFNDGPMSDGALYCIRFVVSLLVSLWVAYGAFVIGLAIGDVFVAGAALPITFAAWLISYGLVHSALTLVFFGAEKTVISRVVDRTTATHLGEKINDVFRPNSPEAQWRRALAWRARWERGREGLRLTSEPRRWWRAHTNADAHSSDGEQR
jgi:hypothetical protein